MTLNKHHILSKWDVHWSPETECLLAIVMWRRHTYCYFKLIQCKMNVGWAKGWSRRVTKLKYSHSAELLPQGQSLLRTLLHSCPGQWLVFDIVVLGFQTKIQEINHAYKGRRFELLICQCWDIALMPWWVCISTRPLTITSHIFQQS